MVLNVKIKPSIDEASEILEKAFRSRKLALIIGSCRVDYEGRASSVLDWGERILLIKQDGSVQVHRPFGYEPVNWQPPRCMLKISHDNSSALTVTASRSQPTETVSIEFQEITLTATGDLADSGEFSMHVTEEQMKQAILIAPDLVEQGLKPLEQEKSLRDAGFTDIYAEDNKGNLVVVEIKRNAATKDAITQLQRYLDTLRRKVNRPLRGIVVAPELRKSAQPMLDSLKLEYVRLAPEKCFTVLKSRRDTKLSQFLS
jgi:RecB family endonuclease NucS